MLKAMVTLFVLTVAPTVAAQDACARGDMAACAEMGYRHLFGKGAPKDYSRAEALLRRGCEGGSARACNDWGLIYRHGWGQKRDYARANALFRRSCDGGSREGCYSLAVMIDEKRGVKLPLLEAVKLYDRSCAAGFAPACHELGLMYANGDGVLADVPRALKLYEKACAAGWDNSCYNAALFFLDGRMKRDQARATTFLKTACGRQDNDSCTLMENLRTGKLDLDELRPQYLPATIAAIEQKSSALVKRTQGLYITDARENQFALNLTYVGAQRDRTAAVREVVEGLTSIRELTCKCDVHFLENYRREVLFRDGGRETWLLVHKNVLKRMERQLSSGDPVTAKVRWAGATREDTHVFLVKDFDR